MRVNDAVIGVVLVLFALPALLILCDGLIRKTTFGMRQISDKVNLEA